MSIDKSIKNSMLTANGLVSFHANVPSRYKDKQHQYFSPETKTFIQDRAKYASNFFEAKVQGLDPDNPYDWQTRLLRMADVVKPSAAILRRTDNYKMVLFADREIEYLLPGSKIETMGSFWLVTNPFNISGGDGAGIVQRCNAVWNYLDYYGNVVSEPMVVTQYIAQANDSDAQESNLITKGYFNVSVQYNDATKQIDTNTRMILGTAAYRVTGYSDFTMEFTGDYDTVRILEFTVRFEEPNLEIDDMENHIAGGKTFSWVTQILGGDTVEIGKTLQLTATSVRNGESVESSEQYPISYTWTSSNEDVATVDENGLVTAVSEGEATITAALKQNPTIKSEVTISVAEVENTVQFTSPVPATLNAYEDMTITAAFFDGTTETDDPIEWKFTGAAKNSYKTVTGAKSATVYGYGYSKNALTVTATCNGLSASVKIKLEGI